MRDGVMVGSSFCSCCWNYFRFPFLSSPQPEQELQTAPTSITQGDSVNNQSEQSAAEQSPSEEQGEAIFRPQ
jgi:hypothetical protein